MEQILGIAGLVLIGVWAISLLVIQIWYLVASFKANVLLTFLSMIVPFLGLYVLIKYWHELKKPFVYNLGVGMGGFAVIMLFAVVFKASLPANPLTAGGALAEESAPAVPVIEPITPIEEVPIIGLPSDEPPAVVPAITPLELPTEPPAGPSWGVETPVLDKAFVTIPNGWKARQWDLPNLGLAMGDFDRGEYVTVHVMEKAEGQSFDAFQRVALAEIREHLITAGEPTTPHQKAVDGCAVVSRGITGRCRLEEQQGRQMAARLSCVEGELCYYYLVQWRYANWDAKSQKNFDSLLKSFSEIDLVQAEPVEPVGP